MEQKQKQTAEENKLIEKVLNQAAFKNVSGDWQFNGAANPVLVIRLIAEYYNKSLASMTDNFTAANFDAHQAEKRIEAMEECASQFQQQVKELKEENEELRKWSNTRFKRIKELDTRIAVLEEALRDIEPFAKEVVSRQTNESVFGYNSEMLTLSSLKKIVEALSGKESNG
jgi:chromosome segregation ATPase